VISAALYRLEVKVSDTKVTTMTIDLSLYSAAARRAGGLRHGGAATRHGGSRVGCYQISSCRGSRPILIHGLSHARVT